MLCALATLTLSGAAQQNVTFASLHASYRAGDLDPFTRALPDYATFRKASGRLISEIERQPPRWDPTRATAALELALWVVAHSWPEGNHFIKAAHSAVTERGTQPGEDAAIDRYEITFHHVALTALISANQDETAAAYLLATDRRIATDTSKSGRLNDPRWELTRGWLAEIQSSPTRDSVNSAEPVYTLAGRSATAMIALRASSEIYARAMKQPSVAAEASVRYAFVLHRLGSHRDAAAALSRITSAQIADDRVVQYWRAIIAGRVHEALSEPGEAEREYHVAADRWPGAQTPLIALASLLERRGRASEADNWSDRVRVMPPTTPDPWWFYWTADRRFLASWLQALREVRQ